MRCDREGVEGSSDNNDTFDEWMVSTNTHEEAGQGRWHDVVM